MVLQVLPELLLQRERPPLPARILRTFLPKLLQLRKVLEPTFLRLILLIRLYLILPFKLSPPFNLLSVSYRLLLVKSLLIFVNSSLMLGSNHIGEPSSLQHIGQLKRLLLAKRRFLRPVRYLD